MSQWSVLQRRAKSIESRLQAATLVRGPQARIDQYSAMAHKLSTDFRMYDEEHGPLLGGSSSSSSSSSSGASSHQHPDDDAGLERQLAKDIDADLQDLNDCISAMKDFNNTGGALSSGSSSGSLHGASSGGGGGGGSRMNDELIKRYHEIYYDFNTEFKNVQAAIGRKRDSMRLFSTSGGAKGAGLGMGMGSLSGLSSGGSSSSSSGGAVGDGDHAFDKLLKERGIISQSMRTMSAVLNQAYEARSMLTNQGATLAGANSGLAGISTTGGTIGRLVDSISRKKSNEGMVIALFIALLLCFTVWWVFLR